jgi:hypothetical protein
MASFRNETARTQLIDRLHRLDCTAKPQWGKLDAPRMICHLGDTVAMALGELQTVPANRTAFQRFPLKHLILYVLPFPKSVLTAPELLSTAPGDFAADRQRLLARIDRLAALPQGMGTVHPFFGPLNNEEWNSLQWKHVDHHLKQFGL